MADSGRNVSIDILKALAIILIILAHINPPYIIFQLRNFDVVLLVIISGMLSVNSYKKCGSYFEYIKKRFIRLVVPVWIFLTMFFLGNLIFSYSGKYYSLKEIIESYLLLDGIGYVWIFRVYLLNAITIPVLLKAKEKLKTKVYYIILVSIYFFYELLYILLGNTTIGIIDEIIYYIIPYGICTAIGFELKEFNNKILIKIIVIMLLIFISITAWYYLKYNTLTTTNTYKYPPRIYYFSYAIMVSIFLYYVIDRKNIFNINNLLNLKIVKFISIHTMWIYLWHIFYLIIVNRFIINWLLKFIIILVLSLLTTYIQSVIVRKTKKQKLIALLDC